MEDKTDDDEIPNYITELNTVVAIQGISSNAETLPKTVISSQSKSLLQTANLKKVFRFIFDQTIHFKIFFNKLYGGTMIKLRAIFLLGFFLILTANLKAQQWTAEQQEVWKTINAQWQADKDGKNWVDEFVHPDCFGWNNSTPMPSDKANITRWFNAYQKISKTIEFQITPAAIIVKGNLAVAHYYYVILNESYDKKIEREIGRWTDILIKDGNKWLFIAWQGGSDKSED